MSILVRFTGAPGLSAETYDATMPAIEASGQFPPDGLDYHVAFVAGGSFCVSEIWDSMEQFEAFGQRLMPILSRGRRRARRSAADHRDPQHHQAVVPRHGRSDERARHERHRSAVRVRTHGTAAGRALTRRFAIGADR